MELLYNPDVMSEKDIKKTFVARESLVNELVSLIDKQPQEAGIQHVIILGPRGMGKTTLLLMVKFAIKDSGLADRWLPIKFPEELYSVYDLADFWIETLSLIAAETADEQLRQTAKRLKVEHPNNDELQNVALATIKEWGLQNNKRLVLLVENFDQVLKQIEGNHDSSRLRDVLLNETSMVLIGGATSLSKITRANNHAFDDLFKIYSLDELKFEQTQTLLRSRAEVDQIPDFGEKLRANHSRLRALLYFTGGNPRLVLILYRVVSQTDITEVRLALEKLLDEVTPYYKAKVETLPAQQRKIVDHIARVSSETKEALSPKEIAGSLRLPPNQVSSQLKRLSGLGFVRSANLRGRRSYYTLSEPLYAVWHQMRFGRDDRLRIHRLITFLRIWYEFEEIGSERFHDHIHAMATVIVDQTRSENSETTINEEQVAHAGGDGYASLDVDFAGAMAAANLSYSIGHFSEALRYLDLALKIRPHDDTAWNNRGVALGSLGNYEEAIASYNRTLELRPDYDAVWNNRGLAYLKLFIKDSDHGEFDSARSRWAEALESARKSRDKDWPNDLSEALVYIARIGQLKFARELIGISGLEEILFPLARAIDYLHSGEIALIEKLSPEVKGIVEEVIAKLRPAANVIPIRSFNNVRKQRLTENYD
ncbi:MAG: tetratricopeptide repeat protein [Acidobacteria bacterium]|nr:tetratricopeptide repeat protein [Acidobacteriota bacterium]